MPFQRRYYVPGTHKEKLVDLKGKVGTGWLALYCPKGWNSFWSRLIADSTRGPYSHAAMLRVVTACDRTPCDGETIDLLEMKEGAGGRAIPFESMVKSYPGCWDLYQPDLERWPEYNAEAAVAYMRELTGKKYGKRALYQLIIRRIPFLWHWFRCKMEDPRRWSYPPFCSFAGAIACRNGGEGKPGMNLPEGMVTPRALCR